MARNSKPRKPRSIKPTNLNDGEERIRLRAYEFYERRSRIDGFALDDWLQAEAEICGIGKKPKPKVAKPPQ